MDTRCTDGDWKARDIHRIDRIHPLFLAQHMIEAAIFDMDGLLVDSEPFWRKAEMEAFGEVDIHLSENDCRETMGWRLNEVVALWHSRQPWTGPSQAEVEADILKRVSRYILEQATPLPGVMQAIAICRKAGLKTAIASSSPMQLIDSVVTRFNLKDSFQCLHSAQYESYGKPHPAVFINAAQMLGVPAPRCLVFEDSFHGMIAGLAARMKVIVVPAPEDASNLKYGAAHHKIESLLDFELGMLAQLA
jgi:sugar-phosphatase